MFLFPDLCRSPKLGADLRALWQLTRFMREQQYDIVHTHNAKAGILGRIAAHWAATPIILHTFHLLSWQDAMTTERSFKAQLSAGAKGRIFFFLEKYAATLSDKIVTVCQENRQEATAAQLAPADKIMTIYSGIDVEHLRSDVDRATVCARFGLDPDRPIVGMIGRLSPQKAPLDFVQAAKLVLQSNPDVQFILVGDGPLTPEVAAAIGAESRIKMLGYRNDVPEILRILDIFALASLWEGLGRAMTEAMLMAIPVVATAVNGIPELVKHGETGLLSPPQAPAQLAANLVRLLDNPIEAQSMGQSGPSARGAPIWRQPNDYTDRASL
ncbi:MAG: glycosyltransferase family 4 protein [Caldilineaceae bacterium]